MDKNLRSIILLAALGLFLIGCSTNEPAAPAENSEITEEGEPVEEEMEESEMEDEAVSDEPLKIALVATQAAGDNGPIDGMIAGLAMAEAELGAETQFIEALDPATFETTLRNLATAGTDIIISTFFAMGDATAIVAPEFPDTKFVVIVAAPIDPPLPNVQVMDYQFFEGAYVGGVYAAQMTQSNQLGYTGGIALPFAWADFNAFTAGAKSVNTDIETTAVFVESFEDPVKGRELAAGLYASGVDFIFTGAAASDIGVIEAATDADGLVMVSSTPLVDQSPENVGIVVSIEWADTILKEIKAAADPAFAGGYRKANVRTNEIKFDIPQAFLDVTSDERRAAAEAALASVNETVAAIENGTLMVQEVGEEMAAGETAMAEEVMVEPMSIALVATQAAGDNGPIDGMIAGLELAAEQHGHETQFIEALDPATFETTLRNLATAGTDIIISTFFAMGDATAIVAPEFPDTKFIVIVAAPIDPPLANVQVMDYQFFEGAYVGGVYAALMTETDQLGYTGGIALPFAWADFNAYTAGAQSINPEIETTAVFIESFEDPVKGRELAAGLYASGVDFIFTGAAASDIGVVEAATDSEALVMVSSTPLVEQSPANVGIVVSIEWAETILREIEVASSADFVGGYRKANVRTGEIKFDVPQAFLDATTVEQRAKAEAALPQIEEIVAGIESGEIVIEEIGEEQ